jgi:formiminotetrahydrofolate cyclodeaminase
MPKTVGTNVSYEVSKDNKLTITVDLKKTNGKSKSGKTITIASTQGNVTGLDKDEKEFKFGLNVYKYPKEKDEESEE